MPANRHPRNACGSAACGPLPGLALQRGFPPQRAIDDRVQIIEPGRPAELRADAVGPGDQYRRIARAPRLLADAERLSGHALHAVEYLAHAVAVAVAAVEHRR